MNQTKPTQSPRDSKSDPPKPDGIEWIIDLFHPGNFKRYWWAYLIAMLVVSIPATYKLTPLEELIKEWIADFRLSGEIEKALESNQRSDYAKINPPIPLQIGDTLHFGDYLRHLPRGSRFTVTFVVGPGGSGKSVFRRQFLKEMHSENPHNHPVGIQLSAIGGEGRVIDSWVGNGSKFNNIGSTFAGEPHAFEDWLAILLKPRLSENTPPDRIKKKLLKKSKLGLKVVIDDFDETDRDSRRKILTLIYKSLGEQELERLQVIILSRADALIDLEGIRNLNERKLELGSAFQLNVVRISAFRESMDTAKYVSYWKDALSTLDDSLEARAERAFSLPDIRTTQKVRDYMAWLEGANYVFQFLSDRSAIDDREMIRLDALDRHMDQCLYNRAKKVHGFPEFRELRAYQESTIKLLKKVKRSGATYSDSFRPLLFTGLIEIVPVRLTEGTFSILLQYPGLEVQGMGK